jgi:peptide deformylase
MSLRPILTWPDDRLSAQCAPVGAVTDAVRTLAADLLETMYDAPGRGLAAPQVGVLRRVFVMDATWKEGTPSPVVCIDPAIVSFGDVLAEASEGCLSLPGVMVQVTRPTTVRMTWTDLDGVRQDRELTGFAALCAQHELDHLDGIVTLDRVDADQRAHVLAHYEAL